MAELRFDEPQRFGYVVQPVFHCIRTKSRDVSGIAQCEFHFDAASITEVIALAHCLRHHENVAEKNRRIETEAANGLQRYFRRELRRSNEFEKRILFFERAVFRQTTAGLAHHPNRRAIRCATMARVEETTAAVVNRGGWFRGCEFLARTCRAHMTGADGD